MFLKKNLFFLFLLISNFCVAQFSTTELIYKKKAEYFTHINIDSLIHYSKLLQSSNNVIPKYDGIFREISVHYLKGDYDKSEELALKLIHLIGDSEIKYLRKLKLESLNRLFWIYKNTNKLSKAFQITLTINDLIEGFDKKSEYFQIVDISNKSKVASIKMELGLFDEALDIYKLLEKKYFELMPKMLGRQKNSVLISISSLYNKIGKTYLALTSDKNDPLIDSASIYFSKALDISKLFNPKHKNSEYQYNLERTRVLIKKEKFDTALALLNLNKYNDINIAQDTDFLKSLTYKNLNNVDSSMYYAYKFLDYKKRVPSTEKNRIVIYNILAYQYNIKNEIDSAYKYSLLAKNKLDKFYNSKNKAHKKHYLYDFNQIKKVPKSILKNEKRIRNSLLVFSGIILVFMAVFLVLYRKQGYTLQKSERSFEKVKKTLRPLKKEYLVNKELEEMVLNKLLTFEQSRLYLDSKFSIQVLAKKFKTNTTYLSFIINERKGKTFKQYITELRIHYLLQELENNPQIRKYSIKALGEEVGYTNASAFTRAFKNFVGKLPSEYIASIDEKDF